MYVSRGPHCVLYTWPRCCVFWEGGHFLFFPPPVRRPPGSSSGVNRTLLASGFPGQRAHRCQKVPPHFWFCRGAGWSPVKTPMAATPARASASWRPSSLSREGGPSSERERPVSSPWLLHVSWVREVWLRPPAPSSQPASQQLAPVSPKAPSSCPASSITSLGLCRLLAHLCGSQ